MEHIHILLFGLVCTFVFLAWVKRIGHDSANYYNVKYVVTDGKPGHHHGFMYAQMNSIRQFQNKLIKMF